MCLRVLWSMPSVHCVFWFQFVLQMTEEFTVVEMLTGLFTRRNLTLDDPPLVSITCTHNCGPEMWIIERTMNFQVSAFISNSNVSNSVSSYIVSAFTSSFNVSVFTVLLTRQCIHEFF